MSSQQASFNSQYWEPRQKRQAEKLWESYMTEAKAQLEAWRDEAVREGKIEVLNRLPEVNDAWAKYHGNMTYAEFALQTLEEERL